MTDRSGFLRQGRALVEDGGEGEGSALDGVVDDGKALRVAVRGRGLLVLDGADGHRARARWLAASVELAPPLEIARLVVELGLTGALEVKSPAGVRRLFFEEGGFTGAQSGLLEDAFGQILWRAGRVSLDQLLIAVEEIKGGGRRIGRVLIDLGYLTTTELRPFLRRQAEVVLEAACVVDRGFSSFFAGVTHQNPMRFFAQTASVLDGAKGAVAETRELRARIGNLDAPFAPSPSPSPREARLGEAETAMMQLLHSTRGAPLSGRALLYKAGLGEIDGLRALRNLVDAGLVRRGETSARVPAAPPRRMDAMCELLNDVVGQLDAAGFGLGDEVRAFALEPPAGAPAALSIIKLDANVRPAALLELGASEAPPFGPVEVERALTALLDFALFQARDTLPTELSRRLDARAAAIAAQGSAQEPPPL